MRARTNRRHFKHFSTDIFKKSFTTDLFWKKCNNGKKSEQGIQK